ncbi:MAG TPA: hypothetical protein VN832_04115 [Stellaceae bacterium]|nr:hypothetical protein [Stellaceae bacterium]
MDEELARQMAATALRCGSSLEELIPQLSAHCAPVEIETYVKAIASVMATIHDEILKRLFVAHPELQAEIEQNINTRGAAF